MEQRMEPINQEDTIGQAPQMERERHLAPALSMEASPMTLPRRRHPLTTPKGLLLALLVVLLISAGVLVGFLKLQTPQVPAGRVQWTHAVGPLSKSTPTVSNGMVYIGTRENMIYALSAPSGQVIWSTQLGHYTDFPAAVQSGIVPTPVVSDGLVYANSQDDFLYALDTLTGHTIWSFHVVGGDMAAPAVANGIAYIGSEGGVLYALDAHTGRQLWSYQTLDFLDVPAAVANGRVYVDGAGDALYALDAISGRKQWVGTGRYTPTVANGVAYVTTSDGELSAYDAPSGREQWAFFSTHCCGFTSPPLVVGQRIYIYSLGGVVTVDARTHQEGWFHRLKVGGTWTTPVIVQNRIYLIAADRTFQPPKESLDIFPDKDELDVLDAATGNDLWFYPLGGLVFSSPAVSNGVTYVGVDDGKLYAVVPPR
ncbi:MAG TPA: PQQ-binding-like beta-propeller repeat protein [Ktedonobacterales bacterium]|nr:PQQ-binding-like beta-propeller repeat protein [Ktedonobacterales bacterium]